MENVTFDVDSHIDNANLTMFHWSLLAICFGIVAMDGYDIVSLGFISPSLIERWHVTRTELAPAFMAGLFGLAVGGMIGGPVADRVGRRKVIILATFFFGATSLASALSTGVFRNQRGRVWLRSAQA